jgi:hypothetical protein
MSTAECDPVLWNATSEEVMMSKNHLIIYSHGNLQASWDHSTALGVLLVSSIFIFNRTGSPGIMDYTNPTYTRNLIFRLVDLLSITSSIYIAFWSINMKKCMVPG